MKPGGVVVGIALGVIASLAAGTVAYRQLEPQVDLEQHREQTDGKTLNARAPTVGTTLAKRLVDSELSAIHSNLLALSALRDDRIQDGIDTLETSLDLSVLVLDELRSEFGADERVPKVFDLIARQRAHRLRGADTAAEENIDRVIEEYGQAAMSAAVTPDSPSAQ